MDIGIIILIGSGLLLASQVLTSKMPGFSFLVTNAITSKLGTRKADLKSITIFNNNSKKDVNVTYINYKIYYDQKLIGTMSTDKTIVVPKESSKNIFNLLVFTDNAKFITDITLTRSGKNLPKPLEVKGHIMANQIKLPIDMYVPIKKR